MDRVPRQVTAVSVFAHRRPDWRWDLWCQDASVERLLRVDAAVVYTAGEEAIRSLCRDLGVFRVPGLDGVVAA